MNNPKEQCQCNDLFTTCEKCVDKACNKILKEIHKVESGENWPTHSDYEEWWGLPEDV